MIRRRLRRFLRSWLRDWDPEDGVLPNGGGKQLVFNRLWEDLSQYNAERHRGVLHRQGWMRYMAQKQELYNLLQGEGPHSEILWDEAEIRRRYPEQAMKAFDAVYDHKKDEIVLVVEFDLPQGPPHAQQGPVVE